MTLLPRSRRLRKATTTLACRRAMHLHLHLQDIAALAGGQRVAMMEWSFIPVAHRARGIVRAP